MPGLFQRWTLEEIDLAHFFSFGVKTVHVRQLIEECWLIEESYLMKITS